MLRIFLRRIFYICILAIILFSLNAFYSLYHERYIPPDISIEQSDWYDYPGAVHFHTVYSDGGGDFDEVIEEAQKIGLKFVLSADHNTIQPYLDGVEGWREGILLLTGVEISSSVGHLLYYDSGDHFRNYDPAKVEELLKTGAGPEEFLIIAHPFHSRMEFKHWSSKGFTGIELFNGDVQWRDDSLLEIFTAVFGALLFEHSANHLIDYPLKNIQQWDQLLKNRRVAGLGSADAHSKIKINRSFSIRFPTYASSFDFVKTHILTQAPLCGNLATDRKIVINALRKGCAYIELGDFCDPKGFSFTAVKDSVRAMPGDKIILDGKINLTISSPDTDDVLIRLIESGNIIKEVVDSGELHHEIEKEGAYRAEIFQIRKEFFGLRKKMIPWVISNPIFITI